MSEAIRDLKLERPCDNRDESLSWERYRDKELRTGGVDFSHERTRTDGGGLKKFVFHDGGGGASLDRRHVTEAFQTGDT